tara:strand:- start:3838 stop:4413 length:576 start_codon:yes stop_codon:yes gene_type:complete
MINIKFMNKIILLTIVFFSFVISTNAQVAGFSQKVDALATIVAPIEITGVLNMEFGDISRTSANSDGTDISGVIRMSTAGVVSTASGNVQPVTGGETPAAASITVSGESTATFKLTVTQDTALTLSSNTATTVVTTTNTMQLSSFTTSGSSTANSLSTGPLTITIGADLAVNTLQETGSYAGKILVVAEYE